MKMIRQLIEAIKNAMRMPSSEMMALTELEQAKRELLQMQTAKDYSTRMVEYNKDRIRRLSEHLANASQVQEQSKLPTTVDKLL